MPTCLSHLIGTFVALAASLLLSAAQTSVAASPAAVKNADAGETLSRSTCSGCHMIGRGDHLAPDLANRGPDQFVRRMISDPAGTVAGTARGQTLYATWGYQMPDFGLDAAQIDSLLAFLNRQDSLGPLQPLAPVALDASAFEQARKFNGV